MVFANATNVTNLVELMSYNQSVTGDMYTPFLVLAFYFVAFLAVGFDLPRRFEFANFVTFLFAMLLSFGFGILPSYYAFLLLALNLIGVFMLYFEKTRQR